MSAMLNGYIECALWSSSDVDEEGNETRLDEGQEISEELQKQFEEDISSFRELCEKECPEELAEYLENEGESRFGHDFWLTRNGHGAGFWDRSSDGYPSLTKWSETFGEQDLYIGDDGKVYG